MKIAISAESTIDLSKELLEKFDIKTVPFHILLGKKDALDGEIDPQEIFDFVDKEDILPKTSAVNEYQYLDHFNNLLKEYDYVIHFSLSSEMSSACQNANTAAGQLSNVSIIDSRSLSTGIALLAISARKLANEGKQPKEIVRTIKERIKDVQASFVVNTLDYLYKGGRCSSLVRFGANLLRLKPQILVIDGKMDSGKKYRGKNKEVIEDYCEDTLKQFDNPDLSIAFVTHSHASPDMVEVAKEALKKRGFKEIYETVAGATISSHCGPKTLGILFINDGNK